jgi:hypothetical protein
MKYVHNKQSIPLGQTWHTFAAKKYILFNRQLRKKCYLVPKLGNKSYEAMKQ